VRLSTLEKVPLPWIGEPVQSRFHPSSLAAPRSAVLAKVADEIEAQLGPWRGEKE
jgi:hypothetical protein